jgi:hypothetical protein
MYDLDAIAAINVDQLATVTDRLLVGGVRKRRPLARGSVPVLVDDEPTLFVRHAPTRGLGFAVTVGAVAGVFAIALLRLLA